MSATSNKESDSPDSSIQATTDELTKRYLEEIMRSSEGLAQHSHVLSAILDSIGVGVIVFDADEKVMLSNRTAIKMAGRDVTHMHRRDAMKLFSFFKDEGETPVPDEEFPYFTALQQRKTASVEGFVLGSTLPKEGIWLNSIAAPIIDQSNQLIGVVTVIRDITQNKRLERQRNTLATLITHDLKNHLAGWDMWLELLQEQATAMDLPEAKLLDDLVEGNRRFLELANNLLEVYRSDFFVLESCRSEIDLEKLLLSAVALNQTYASARGVGLQLDIKGKLPSIKAIPAALSQGLHNLIQNAIGVSEPGMTVDIHALASDRRITIEVHDQGPGLSPEKLQRIFDQARVAASSPRAVTSTGFGLYLTRLLIEAHGGRITCLSEPGNGATFKVQLPVDS